MESAVSCGLRTGQKSRRVFQLVATYAPRDRRPNPAGAQIDRAQWFRGGEALEKILPGQKPIVLKLFEPLGSPYPAIDRVQNRNVCPTRIVAWVVCATRP